MRPRNATTLAIALGGIFWAFQISASDARPSAQQITVNIQPDGTHCAVKDLTMPCSEVPNHLKHVLKVPIGARVHLIADPTAKYESVESVLKALARSGYAFPIGYVSVRE